MVGRVVVAEGEEEGVRCACLAEGVGADMVGGAGGGVVDGEDVAEGLWGVGWEFV